MSCTDQFLVINNAGIVTQVYPTKCVQISSKVKGFSDGTTTSNVFSDTFEDIETIDFTSAINLATIGSYSFYRCSKVKIFDLSSCESLSSIGIDAFCNCTGATSIIFPTISKLSILPSGCFSYCTSLPTFTIPNTIITIEGDNPSGFGVFASCSSLTEIIFAPDSQCESIGGKVFLYSGLINITLPKTIKIIDGYSFRTCKSLENINVEEGNGKFKSYKGILLNINDIIVYFPQKNQLISGNELTIPKFIKSFSAHCFAGVQIDLLTIPENITTLPYRSFAYSQIKKFIISSSISTIV